MLIFVNSVNNIYQKAAHSLVQERRSDGTNLVLAGQVKNIRNAAEMGQRCTDLFRGCFGAGDIRPTVLNKLSLRSQTTLFADPILPGTVLISRQAEAPLAGDR